jgi:DNA polymerase III epsilon subunit-like protein
MFERKRKAHRTETPPPDSGWAATGTHPALPPQALGALGADAISESHKSTRSANSYAKSRIDARHTIAVKALKAAGLRDWVAIDTETSGFSSTDNVLVEVGAAAFHDTDLVGTWSARCCPEPSEAATMQLHPLAVRKHGITLETLCQTGRPTVDVLYDLLTFVAAAATAEKTAILFHNQAFDVRFLTAAFVRHGEALATRVDSDADPQRLRDVWAVFQDASDPNARFVIVCTMALFRAMYPEQPADLDTALTFVGCPWRRENVAVHRADEDARLAGRLFHTLTATIADFEDDESQDSHFVEPVSSAAS